MATLSDPRKEAYLQYLLTAPSERNPRSHEEFGKTLEPPVARRTLYGWRQEKEFHEEWSERARAVAGDPERTTMLLDALFQQALDPDSTKQVQAAKAWADIAGVIKPPPKPEQKADGKALTDLSTEELDAMLAEILESRQ